MANKPRAGVDVSLTDEAPLEADEHFAPTMDERRGDDIVDEGFADTLVGASPTHNAGDQGCAVAGPAVVVTAKGDDSVSSSDTLADGAAMRTTTRRDGAASTAVEVVIRSSAAPRADASGGRVPVSFGAHLQLGRKLGAGGMGDVFAAREETLNRDVAVKVLAPRALNAPAAWRRFHREAQVTAQLSHPNVVPVYTMEASEGGAPAMTMKLVEGITFDDYVSKCREDARAGSQAPAYQQATRIEHFLKICDALAYSHSCGVIHRDLKPQNFMLGAFNEVYVMDWGMARLLGADDEAEAADPGDAFPLDEAARGESDRQGVIEVSGQTAATLERTQDGSVMGTPLYMAPEQAVGRWDEVGPAADQFSLGLVLYELLTLRRGREATSLVDMIALAAEPPPLSFHSDDGEAVAPALRSIIAKATAKRPEQRYASVRDFAEDLRSFQRLKPVSAHNETPPQRLWRRIQRHPMRFLSLLIAILVVAAGATTYSLSKNLDLERAQARRQQSLIRLVTRFTEHVHKADHVFSLQRAAQEGLARMVELRLRQAREGRITGVAVNAVRTTKWLHARYVETYRQHISSKTYSYFMAPKSDRAAALRDLRMLSEVEVLFRDVFMALLDPKAARLPVAQRRKIPVESGLFRYAYIGLESGTVLDFPAHSSFPDDYDPRKRPWYASAVERGYSSWGIPYPDASGSGFLLPCSGPIHGNDGELLGVVGVDMSNDSLIDLLDIPGLAGLRGTLLVDQAGDLITSSGDRGLLTNVSLRGNRSKGRERLAVPELVEQIRSDTLTGVVWHGRDLYLFAKLSTLGFAVVAQIDPTVHGLLP